MASNRVQNSGLYSEDDEESGFRSKWVPRSQRPNRTAEELQGEMLGRNDQLTEDILRMKQITEQTKGVAGETLATLHQQGEQINRIHRKTVETEQELRKGEKLLGKLGGMCCCFGYMPKKGKKVTGPKDYSDDEREPEDGAGRAALGLDPWREKAGSRPNTQGMGAMQAYEAERKFQDDVLDDVIDNLDQLGRMAKDMHGVVGRHVQQLDDVNEDVKEVINRTDQANRKANQIKRKG